MKDNLKAGEIAWVCEQCGKLFGNGRPKYITVSTWHQGECDICGKEKAITEPRDFGHMNQHKLDHY